jgi:Tfp pilus assembly protein PilF|tara:strand:+ start:59 stop:481 length:423 start_codon:yes stop_codon:yes gene_type:complete
MIKKLFYLLISLFFVANISFAKTEYFQEGIDLYKQNQLERAKFKFEQDIVFNPKSELSYLYLSKIFNKQDKKALEEQNLKTVMLLNPKNEEAIYNLAKLKLSTSDYKRSRELNKKLKSICKEFCNQSDKLKIEIDNLSKK